MEKRRVYQVAKDFHISSEALVSMLKDQFDVRNHMSLVTDEMLDIVKQQFQAKHQEPVREKEPQATTPEVPEKNAATVTEAPKPAPTVSSPAPAPVSKPVSAPEPTLAKAPASISTPAAPVQTAAPVPAPSVKPVTAPAPAPEPVVAPTAPTVVTPPAPAPVSVPTPSRAPEMPRVPSAPAGVSVGTTASAPSAHSEAGAAAEGAPTGPSRRKRKKKRGPKPDSEEAKTQTQQSSSTVTQVRKPAVAGQPASTEDKKSRSKVHKRKKKVDMAAVQDTFKKTLASISADSKRSKKTKSKHASQEMGEDDRNVVKVSEFVSVAELANQMGVPASALVAKCLEMGTMVSINQRLDMETITLLTEEFGFEVEQLGEYAEDVFKTRETEEEREENQVYRPPVVTVMGHVDHGKTTLLDRIRHANVAAGESGGITQHIGAYSVTLPKGQITFIDTPGHKAFTAMRARGAQVTDIVILVVAADDSVMPQTIEAIDHAKAAGVPIVIAINKVDLPGSDPERIRQDLARNNVLVEDWGGPYQCQEISAKKGMNIDKLLEKVLLEAEILELKADPDKRASGVVIDSKLDRGRGAIATVLIQSGTMHVGDPFITGMITGRVRAMINEFGDRVDSVGPSQPALIFGMDGVPKAGDKFYIVESESEARDIAQKRRIMKREQDFRRLKRITLSDLYDQIKEGSIKDLNLIIKGDVDGSVEALSDSLSQITHPEVRIQIIHQGVGGINENDVLLAAASDAVIVGFHVRPSPAARALAETEDVEIKVYEIIYEILDDVKNALSGLLAPKVTEKVIGTAEIRTVFKVPKSGNIAGSYVTSGVIKRSSRVRVVRDNVEVHSGKLSSLRRFKDDVTEVNQGYECGIGIDHFDDIRVGDIIEAIEIIEEARSL